MFFKGLKMNKLFFLILSCIVAHGSVDAMERKQESAAVVDAIENPADSPVKLVYTKHALERMNERGITEAQVESIIESGNKFLDAEYPDCIMYQDRSVKTSSSPVFVAAKPLVQNKILVITLPEFDVIKS
jgi:hypothetical protein